MSAKLLHALTDDNPDLRKQIGCMTGFFQLFDRHHILTGRSINGHSHKRLPPGHSHINNGDPRGVEANNVSYLPTPTVRNLNKNVKENRRASIESSRPSFSSSSCSSSFSSLDCNKTAQSEPSSFDQIVLPETPSRDKPVNQLNASPRMGRQSFDFRDVVKDSIYRETQGLSVKTTTKEEAVRNVMKHRDSPRPFQLSKSGDGSYGTDLDGRTRVPVDLNESLRVLAKIREAPWNFNETREPPRSSYETRNESWIIVSKDAPRFSYDGREIARRSFESRDTLKAATKLRELPRLSLDSREGSMRGSNSDSKSNSILKDLRRNGVNSNRISNSHQESESYKRPPSVVAKLMGLEALPSPAGQMELVKTRPGDDHESYSRPLKTIDETKRNRNSGSPRNFLKDPVSPRLKNPDSVLKPISSSRFPIEPAPWRQQDKARSFPKQVFRNREGSASSPYPYPSVYSEIEKRLKELEFKQSDKDLRALKQIMGAIQSKGLLETRKEENQISNSVPQWKYHMPSHNNLKQNPSLANRRTPQNNGQMSATIKRTSPPGPFESPIVIMKPAKLIQKSGVPASSVVPIDGLSGLRKPRSGDSEYKKRGSVNNRTTKDLTPKQSLRDNANQTLSSIDKKNNGKSLRLMQTSIRPQNLPVENTSGSSVRNSGSVSPRLQQKKLELEKQSRPSLPLSDSSNPRRQSIKQPVESGSPGGKRRPKSPNLQKSDDHLSEISPRSDNNISLATQIDIEVSSADRSAEINFTLSEQGSQSPYLKAAGYLVSSLKQKKPSPRLSEEVSNPELAIAAPEQPSPVSVLDASFYRDDSPSPVMKISNAFKDDENQNSDDNAGEDEWNSGDLDHLSNSTGPYISSEINCKKLDSIEHLVEKLRRLNSNHNEATTDYIASLCNNTHPDHRYISEMMLASGFLLRDIGSGLRTIQLHSPGHPINPDLFFVLEQTKARNRFTKDEHSCEKFVKLKTDQEKLHRKLVFDAVNEILLRKFTSEGPSLEPWLQTSKLSRRNSSAQQLLRELSLEIKQLQSNNSACNLDDNNDSVKSIMSEDVMHRSESWTDFGKEISGVVLDVERLIFKDLVDEIVSGETANLRTKPSRRCRQLFSK